MLSLPSSLLCSRLPLIICYTISAIPLPSFPFLYLILSILLSPFLHPSFPFLPSISSSLPGITLVDKTTPVDEPSDSDQVTEGVKFAYTLPHQQSNQEENEDDTALVCVFIHVHVCQFVCVYFGVYIYCREYGVCMYM